MPSSGQRVWRSSEHRCGPQMRTLAANAGSPVPRRECLDWLLIVGRRHLEAVLAEYVEHYNGFRPPAPPQPGAAAAPGAHRRRTGCQLSGGPPDASGRADQRVLAAGRLTERTAGARIRACQSADTPWGWAVRDAGWTPVAHR